MLRYRSIGSFSFPTTSSAFHSFDSCHPPPSASGLPKLASSSPTHHSHHPTGTCVPRPHRYAQNCSKTYAAATTGINVNYLPKTNWGQFVKVGNADGSYTYH